MPNPAKSKSTAKKSATIKPKSRAAGKAPKAVPTVKKVGTEKAQEMIDILCRTYPDAECELTFRNDFELLISVILSAQCTDATVNKVTPVLFKRFPTPKSLAEAPLDEIKEVIRPTGFFNAKAQNIQKCAISLVEKFGGKVPTTLEEMTTLAGVGRKTANAVLGVAHGVSGWTVDTHVQRLSRRLGLTRNNDPPKIEQDLQKLFPGQDWSKLSITLIWHGRRRCYARKPDCPHCPINHLCPSSLV